MLANPRVSIYDVLMVEFCLQEEHQDEPGAMKAAYMKQLYRARDKATVTRQVGVLNLATAQRVLLASELLREIASYVITTHKIKYADVVSGLASALGAVQATPDESLMALMTRTRDVLEGKPVKAKGELQIRKSRKGKSKQGQLTLEWREAELRRSTGCARTRRTSRSHTESSSRWRRPARSFM